ncbi:MAG: hypothetical protein QM674_19740, partial [Burkholderiaceae bacterium]
HVAPLHRQELRNVLVLRFVQTVRRFFCVHDLRSLGLMVAPSLQMRSPACQRRSCRSSVGRGPAQ